MKKLFAIVLLASFALFGAQEEASAQRNMGYDEYSDDGGFRKGGERYRDYRYRHYRPYRYYRSTPAYRAEMRQIGHNHNTSYHQDNIRYRYNPIDRRQYERRYRYYNDYGPARGGFEMRNRRSYYRDSYRSGGSCCDKNKQKSCSSSKKSCAGKSSCNKGAKKACCKEKASCKKKCGADKAKEAAPNRSRYNRY